MPGGYKSVVCETLRVINKGTSNSVSDEVISFSHFMTYFRGVSPARPPESMNDK